MPPSPTTTSPAPAAARSADDIRHWIVATLSANLNVEPSTIDTGAPLETLGIDSLSAIRITSELSAWLNHDLPATLMWDYPSINYLSKALAEHLRSSAPPKPALPAGVVPLQPDGDRLPLFCLPGIGGHPVSFAHVAAQLGPPHPCYGLTVPGLEGDDQPLARVEDLAAALCDPIRAVQPHGPYQLAGYSLGGLLAYEIARQLVEAGQHVALLAIYDAFTPEGRRLRPLWQRMGIHLRLLATRPGRVDYVRTRLGRIANGTEDSTAPAAPDPTPHGRVQELVRANQRAAASYRPRPYAGDTRVVVFRARDALDLDRFYRVDPSNGWNAMVPAGVHVADVPGNHLTIFDAAHAPDLAQSLRPHLR